MKKVLIEVGSLKLVVAVVILTKQSPIIKILMTIVILKVFYEQTLNKLEPKTFDHLIHFHSRQLNLSSLLWRAAVLYPFTNAYNK